ncbi:MAG: HEAT repeat domain-containing protein [Planctomycetia bacterium]|nr:HEAT repeat domain-containing protein [Planctomycetia bacterium]
MRTFLPVFLAAALLAADASAEDARPGGPAPTAKERLQAAYAALKSWPRTSVPVLQGLADPDPAVRKALKQAMKLGKEGGSSDDVLQASGEAAGKALAAILAVDDVEAAAIAMDYFEDRNYPKSEYSVWVIARELREAKDPAVRRRAAQALNRSRMNITAALPQLRKALSADADASVREAAAGTLGHIAWEDEDAAEAMRKDLEKAAKDADARVRRAAEAALRRCDRSKREEVEAAASEMLTRASLESMTKEPHVARETLEVLMNDFWGVRNAWNGREMLEGVLEKLEAK